MPLIKGFTSTNVWKAFAINSLANALMVTAAFLVKDGLDRFQTKHTTKKLESQLESGKEKKEKI